MLYIAVGRNLARDIVIPAADDDVCVLCAADATLRYAESLDRRGHSLCVLCALAMGIDVWIINRIGNGSLIPRATRADYVLQRGSFSDAVKKVTRRDP